MVLSRLSSKGQITLPKAVRDRLRLIGRGDLVGFEFTQAGVVLKKLSVVESDEGYTRQELGKIEKLARQKGRGYPSADKALDHLARLMK